MKKNNGIERCRSVPAFEMSLLLTTLVLGAVTARAWPVLATAGDPHVAKCCPQGEQLDSDLRKCQPVSNTYAYEVTLTNDTAVGKMLNVRLEERDTSEYSWLPVDLQLDPGTMTRIRFGKPSNCSDRHILRLANPKGERVEWLSNGSLLLISPSTNGSFKTNLFTHEEFCIDTYNNTNGASGHAYLICPCEKVKCVRKCCAFGEAKFCNGDNCTCGVQEGEWTPLHPDLPLPEEDFTYEVLAGNDGVCPDGFAPFVGNPWNDPVHFTSSFWAYPKGDLFANFNVCGDAVVRRGQPPRHGIMRCYRSPPFTWMVDFGYGLHVPESVLLALAIGAILVAPRRRGSEFSYVHDQAMCCHMFCLLGRSITWSFYVGAPSTVCQHTPFIIYFSLVSASLWLNVICVNMTCGFWKPLGLQPGRLGGGKGMLICYSLYAWGISAMMTAFTAAMWHSKEVPQGLIRPTLHETRTCFREHELTEGGGKMATFAYYYGPMAALLAINSLLFSSTAIRICQLRRDSAILSNRVANGKEGSWHKQSAMLYIKLLLLMGVAEMAVDVAAWASNDNEYLFAFGASCLDLARAAAIFAMCCCKRGTVAALRALLLRACRLRAARTPGGQGGQGAPKAGAGGRHDSITTTTISITQDTLCESGDRTGY